MIVFTNEKLQNDWNLLTDDQQSKIRNFINVELHKHKCLAVKISFNQIKGFTEKRVGLLNFKHIIKEKRKEQSKNIKIYIEMTQWCDDNNIQFVTAFNDPTGIVFHFNNDTDAIAFKLKFSYDK